MTPAAPTTSINALYRMAFDDRPWPSRACYGRVRFVLVNDTMMDHPIHLHGMWSDLEDEAGAFRVRKHTINIKAGQKLRYRVTADAFGRWAYHCHLPLHRAQIVQRRRHSQLVLLSQSLPNPHRPPRPPPSRRSTR